MKNLGVILGLIKNWVSGNEKFRQMDLLNPFAFLSVFAIAHYF
jgi:hypothetical protein